MIVNWQKQKERHAINKHFIKKKKKHIEYDGIINIDLTEL